MDRTLPKAATRIADGATRAMACVQGDKKLTAVGKNIMVRIEQTGGVTDGGIHLPESAATERHFVESIGKNVDVANENGDKLKVGDEVLVMRMSKIPVFDPVANSARDIAFLGENDIIAIVG
jgi:co-chaperonin GroES (HSP10)